MIRSAAGAVACLALLAAGRQTIAQSDFSVTVSAGERERVNVPVRVPLTLTKEQADHDIAMLSSKKHGSRLGQLTAPGLLHTRNTPTAPGEMARDLWFVVPHLKPGQSQTWEVRLGGGANVQQFHWTDTKGEYAELTFGGEPVLRYMYRPLDESSPEAREQTYKVFHHLFDPSGKQIVTKGPGGRYTHHRGLFYGFNRISYDGGKKKADTWHARNAHQSHEGFLASEAGPVLGRHRLKIDWHGPDKGVFASEEREMTAYDVPEGQLIEFASILRTEAGPVRLDGDPQHAGFQFRASNEVAAETKSQTYYLRPDGQGKLGQTRNWSAKSPDPKTVNLPWNAMSFVLGDRRFTAVYLDHPKNPKEARYSERDYGRFGSYFEYDLTEDNPLKLNYRLFLKRGELTGERAESLRQDFVDPPQVSVR